MSINPALNLESFAIQSPNIAPPPLNALYLRDGRYDGMSRDDVTATFQAFRDQTETKRLALFFHGGLVDKASGQQSAANEFLAYQQVAFPLFFIWESGFREVLAHHLPLIFAETIFGRVFTHASTLLTGKVAAVSSPQTESLVAFATPAPQSMVLTQAEIDAFQLAIQSDPLIQNEAVAIAKTTRMGAAVLTESTESTSQIPLSSRTLMSPEVVVAVRSAFLAANGAEVNTEGTLEAFPFSLGGAVNAALAIAQSALPILVMTVRRFVKGRDHGMPCTLVEEILRALYLANFGSAMWEEMKKETAEAFGAAADVFGGTAVVEEVCTLVRDKPDTVITLVGHSTGGVYIGNFLESADRALLAQQDEKTQFDILLLAPANTVDFYAQTYSKRVRGVRIFQMGDATEQQDHLLSKDVGPEDPSILGRIYTRSLLYLVSGVCEYFEGQGGSGPHMFDGYDMPILGMDRFYPLNGQFTSADYPSLAELRTQFSEKPGTSKFVRVLSPTAPAAEPGFRSTALKHGNFPGDAETIASLTLCFQDGL
jgi:hypothetical protein